jgi:transketolase
MRSAFTAAILEAAASRDDLVVLSGDAGLGVFDRFREEHPGQFINTGAAEQNAISFAAGLALTGVKPVLYNIIPFLLYRCYEQLRNDVCCQELPVVLAGIGSGVTYATQGMSHYSVEDLGLARTLPNLVTISPSDPVEARAAARFALECRAPVYVRLAKHGEPVLHAVQDIDITAPQLLRQGEGTAIFTHGSIAEEVVAAWEELARLGRPPRVISVPMIQPLATESLLAMLAGVNRVVVVEEHYSSCGLGNGVAALHAEIAPTWRLRLLGIPPRFIHEVRKTAGLRELFGIDAAAIVRAVEGWA